MPEGDAIHRAARRLQVLVGERLEVETPHPRAQVQRVAEVLDGKRLESVEAVGKNPVVCGDKAGFIANTLLFGYLNHAVSMYEGRYASREDIDAAMRSAENRNGKAA